MLSKKRKRLQKLARAQSPKPVPKLSALDELRLELQAQTEILEITRKNPKWAKGEICQQVRPNTRLTKPGSRSIESAPVLTMDKRPDLPQGQTPRIEFHMQPLILPNYKRPAKSRKRKPISAFVPFAFIGGTDTP